MPLNKFIPVYPDKALEQDQDTTLARFGHLNQIVDYVNSQGSAATLQSLTATATTTIDFALGDLVNLTLTSNTILTFANPRVGSIIIKVIQGGIGGYEITWPANINWGEDGAPSLTVAVGKTDIISLIYDGVNFYGSYSLNY